MSENKIKVRVVRPVEGKKIGDEFECYPHEYKFQIKHKSIEVIGDAEISPAGNASLKVDELKAKLAALGVSHDPKLKKDVLVALLDEAEKAAAEKAEADAKLAAEEAAKTKNEPPAE